MTALHAVALLYMGTTVGFCVWLQAAARHDFEAAKRRHPSWTED